VSVPMAMTVRMRSGLPAVGMQMHKTDFTLLADLRDSLSCSGVVGSTTHMKEDSADALSTDCHWGPPID
jgi:hypothetical protein